MSTSTILPVIHPVEGDLHPESLARVHTAVLDVLHGIDRFRDDADAETTPILEAFRELHERHDRQLVTEMASHGHPPDPEGTFHGLLQGGMKRLRDLFQDPKSHLLHHLLDNERQVLEAYNDALAQGGPPDTIDLLQRQREELGGLVVKHDSRLPD